MQGVLLFNKRTGFSQTSRFPVYDFFSQRWRMFHGILWQVLHFTLSFQGISNFSNGEMDESCGSVYFPTSVNEFNKIMHQLYQHTAKNSPSVMFFSDKTFTGKVNPFRFLCFTFPFRCVTHFCHFSFSR